MNRAILPLAMAICLAPTSLAWATPFEDLFDVYGNLSTVAGRGTIREKGVNGWLPSMEGGLAVDAELSRPHIAMADLAGNLYIADKDAHAIRKITTDGRIHTIAGTGVAGFNGDGAGVDRQLNGPNGLFTFGDGTNYILDTSNDRIRKLSTDGTLATVFADPDPIIVGRGLWVSPDESLIYYASSSRVRRWTAETGVTTYATGFADLGNLTVDPTDANVVVTDRDGHRVYKLFEDGSRQAIAGNGLTSGGGHGQTALSTGLEEVRGVYFEPDGSYFLATHRGGQIWHVGTDGIIHLVIDGDNDHTHDGDGEPLTTPGRKISEPRAVTLSPAGDLIITENDFGYIRVVPKLRGPGDLNGDGRVNLLDIARAQAGFGFAFDRTDLADIVQNYGPSSSSSPSTIPEPATVSLLLLAVVGISSRRRRASE